MRVIGSPGSGRNKIWPSLPRIGSNGSKRTAEKPGWGGAAPQSAGRSESNVIRPDGGAAESGSSAPRSGPATGGCAVAAGAAAGVALDRGIARWRQGVGGRGRRLYASRR